MTLARFLASALADAICLAGFVALIRILAAAAGA